MVRRAPRSACSSGSVLRRRTEPLEHALRRARRTVAHPHIFTRTTDIGAGGASRMLERDENPEDQIQPDRQSEEHHRPGHEHPDDCGTHLEAVGDRGAHAADDATGAGTNKGGHAPIMARSPPRGKTSANAQVFPLGPEGRHRGLRRPQSSRRPSGVSSRVRSTPSRSRNASSWLTTSTAPLYAARASTSWSTVSRSRLFVGSSRRAMDACL